MATAGDARHHLHVRGGSSGGRGSRVFISQRQSVQEGGMPQGTCRSGREGQTLTHSTALLDQSLNLTQKRAQGVGPTSQPGSVVSQGCVRHNELM